MIKFNSFMNKKEVAVGVSFNVLTEVGEVAAPHRSTSLVGW